YRCSRPCWCGPLERSWRSDSDQRPGMQTSVGGQALDALQQLSRLHREIERVLDDRDVGVRYPVLLNGAASGVDQPADGHVERRAVGQELVVVGVRVPTRSGGD